MVVEYKLVSLEYFLDSLQEYELAEIFNMLQYSDKNLFECSRMISFFAISPYLKDKITMDELVKFPWEEVDAEETPLLSDKQIERMRRKAKQYNRQAKR